MIVTYAHNWLAVDREAKHYFGLSNIRLLGEELV